MRREKKHIYFIFISAECQTDECKNASILIQSSINPSVDPCEDFYQYVCGRWIEDKLSITYNYPDKFEEAEGEISKDLKKIIQNTFANQTIDTSTAKAKAKSF